MKKRQLKIRIILLSSLVAIMSFLIILYMAFCLDGEYNKAQINEKEPTVESLENQNELPQSSLPTSPNNQQQAPVGESSFPAIDTETYNPLEVLNSENWAVTLINKNFGIGSNYYPTVTLLAGAQDTYADARVTESYNNMYNAALADGIYLTPLGGYRDYQTQKSLYDNKVTSIMTTGVSESDAEIMASERIEPAGYSENGAGLAVDILSTSADFASSKEFEWLTINAHRFGFVLRYPEDKKEITGMIYQPWHWRYVGVSAATEMKEKNLCLEEYLGVV